MIQTIEAICLSFQQLRAKIGIVGLGYVGLPLALRFSEVGYNVIAFDIDLKKISSLREANSYIKHVDSYRVKKAVQNGFEATADFTRIEEVDAIIICVPTPLNRYRDPDLTCVTNALDSLLPFIREGQILSLESTTYPGTTEEIILPRITSRGFDVGQNYFLVYSPEREDPGNTNFQINNIPKVCGGSTAQCLQVGMALYAQVIDQIVPVSSTKAAELTKLLENIHRAVNIGLVNEMKMVADKMGIDINEVIRAAATKPFGFVPYYPGPGLGGHCIPIDPFYLTWKAREFGIHTRFIELAGEVNSAIPNYVVEKVILALNTKQKALLKSHILVLGIAYKKNVDDHRNSPSLVLMKKLANLGAEIAYSDPYIPEIYPTEDFSFELTSTPLSPENICKFDIILLATNHDVFDYELIYQHAHMIVDTRGVYVGCSAKVIKA